MTKTGTWRKTLTKNQGFGATKDPELIEVKNKALSWLQSNDMNTAKICHDTLMLPTKISAIQKTFLEAIANILPSCLASLEIHFASHNCHDFNRQTTDAYLITQPDYNSTAEYIDWVRNIEHVLVDECQDTSFYQFEIIANIIREWPGDDLRSVFFVGDPMQSIYRFRQADLRGFVQASQKNIGQLQLERANLTTNFRSEPNLVHWVNKNFNTMFADDYNYDTLAVPYNKSTAKSDACSGEVHFYTVSKEKGSGNAIAQLIINLQKTTANETIAILVRSRSHLNAVIPVLNNHNIHFHAEEIEKLNSNQDAIDFQNLVKILYQNNKDINYMSLINHPVFEIDLDDYNKNKQHASHCIDAINNTVHNHIHLKHKLQPRDVMQSFLRELGLLDYHDHHIINLCLDIVSESSFYNQLDLNLFLQKFNESHITMQHQGQNNVQIMTIHKSKGLEFDHVILPGLEKAPRGSTKQLLYWQTFNTDHIAHWLSAGIDDKQTKYMQSIQKEQDKNERIRLLYVAATRAKSLTWVIENDDGDKPATSSPIFPIWESNSWETLPFDAKPLSTHTQTKTNTKIIGHFTASKGYTPNIIDCDKEICLGIVGHKLLENYVQYGDFTDDLDDLIEKDPNSLMLTYEQKIDIKEKLLLMQKKLSTSTTWHWLAKDRAISMTEQKIIRSDQQAFIMDRCFIEDETLWIVDYKFSQYKGSMEQFIQHNRAKHKKQLINYAEILEKYYHDLKIHLALYYPTHDFIDKFSYEKNAMYQVQS